MLLLFTQEANNNFNRGNFRVKGDTVDIYPAYADVAYRIHFWEMKLNL